MPTIPSLPGPGRVITAAGSLTHKVVSSGISAASSGLGLAQSIVDRLPGAPDSAGDAATIGANPQRRYRSAGSRNLAR